MNPIFKIIGTALSIAARIAKNKAQEAEEAREKEIKREDDLTLPPCLKEEKRRNKNKKKRKKTESNDL